MVCGSYAGGATGLGADSKNGARRGQVDGIDVIEFALPYSNKMGFVTRTWIFVKFVVRSLKLLFAERYDVCFATSTPLTVGIIAIFARLFTSKRVVFEVRDLWPELPREMGVIRNPVVLGAMSALEWASYRASDRLIALSPGIVDGIVKRGIRRDRIAMIPNGCDVDIFDQPSAPWRPETVPADSLMAVFAGTHGTANGLDAVLAAGRELAKRRRNDIHLVLVGEGREKPRLRALAAEQGLASIHFLDPVPKEKLVGLLKSANLGLQLLANVPAFYFGTSPNKFFDYLAAGLPVLTNYPGWIAQLVSEHECGFAVHPDDPQAFVDGLIDAEENRERLAVMGRRARALAEERFDRTMLADRWVDWVTEPNLAGPVVRAER